MSTLSQDRARGAFLGLAVGDALGTTIEFKAPGSFTPLTDIVGGGPFRLAPGMWTDDTSMALCLAESLLERGFDPVDQLRRYVSWWRKGTWSSTDKCFDIGNTVTAALARFEATGTPWCGSTDPYSAGNGSLMRLSPVPIYYAQEPELAIARAADSSATTHLTRSTLDACRYYAALILGALHGASKEELLASRYSPVLGLWKGAPLCKEIDAIAAGSFKTKSPPDIRGTGYVVQSLEAALWALHTTTDFRSGCLAAANLGEDADTTAAIYGQLAGALYGASGIPAAWLDKLARKDELEAIAARLHEHGARPVPPALRGSTDAPLRVDVLPRAVVPFVGSIGLTFAPGKQHQGTLAGPWKRDVATDLARLVATYQTRHLVILLEDHELEQYK
ncbi:MAG: ADP-ribosylglycohydrolase family protein, partial [Proteobacteria bacterium]